MCFYGELVYKFRKIDFSIQFKKVITRYKKILQHEYSAANCMPGFNPIMGENFASLFNCMTVGRSSD